MLFSFDKKIEKIKEELSDNPDLVCRTLIVLKKRVAILYYKSMVDKKLLVDAVINPILNIKNISDLHINSFNKKIIQSVTSETFEGFEECLNSIVKNFAVILIDGEELFLRVDVEDYPTRQPTEPPTSAVLRGPREGFTESIKTNMALIRKRLATKDLVVKNFFIGRYTNTQVSLCYLKGVADISIVNSITKKLKLINIDGIIDSHYISTFLEERCNSIFRQVGTSEKPDIVSAKMLEGRVAIIVDGSPIVLTLPFIYIEEAQDPNDYYSRAQYATCIRWVRIFGLFMSVIVPGAYLSLRLYHYRVIPLKFLITISNSTQNLPFTPFLEIGFILLLFEVLYQVSLRLPRYIGLATSIVGALILGETGVSAGLISPPGVMIIAISVISVYTIPDESFQLSIIRAIFILLGGMFGLFGIMAGIIYFTNYLNNLNGYGAPYLSPLSPYIKSDMKDALRKVPLTEMVKRPQSFTNKNKKRLKNDEE